MSFGRNSPESSNPNNDGQICLTSTKQKNKALFVNKTSVNDEELSLEGKQQVLSKMKFLLANDNSVK